MWRQVGQLHGSSMLIAVRAPWSTAACAAVAAAEGERVASRYPPPPRAPVGHPRAESGRALQRQQRVPVRGQRGLLGRSAARRAIPKRASACARAHGRSIRPVQPRSRPGHGRGGCLPPRSASSQCVASLHRSGGPRVTRAAVEWHGLKVWCGCASATACGAIGRRSPGQPVALTSSSGLRRAQQANIGADSRAARAGPSGDPTGTLRDRSGALPSHHGASRVKVAHEPCHPRRPPARRPLGAVGEQRQRWAAGRLGREIFLTD